MAKPSPQPRIDPLDLGDFAPTPKARPAPRPEPAAIREVSEAHKFPSRQALPPPVTERPPQRRHRTGRNVQLNIKATAATVERFTRLSETSGLVSGELLEKALDAFEAARKA